MLRTGSVCFFRKRWEHNNRRSFAKRATELGATLHVKEEVVEIITEQNKATAIKLKNKEVIEADHIILNGDLLSVYPKLIGESKRPHFTDKKISTVQPSISAFVILAALDTRLPNLIHHQVYFSNDYENEFVELFHGQYSTDPTIYVCNSSYTDPSLSPTGDNLFILVNAPALSKHRDDIDVAHYKELIYTKLEQQGLPIRKHLIHEQVVTPKDIEKDFYSFRGALYGLSANKKMDAFLRPSNRSQDLSNLYFAGGSTHPGGGSPMVVISGQNVANLLIKQTKGVQKV
ncbi:phytoene desaturase family protein [Halalkalibacter wakoensis]|uniref:phytoene desaturase family protein n=1 Tax=Halalkalibacter wakoensis TaxID=127891 RepID=UPI0034E2CB2D